MKITTIYRLVIMAGIAVALLSAVGSPSLKAVHASGGCWAGAACQTDDGLGNITQGACAIFNSGGNDTECGCASPYSFTQTDYCNE